MPLFAANLAYLFTERPLLERIGAAAAAGFPAVELQMPYDVGPSARKSEIDRHRVTMLGLNTAVGRDGETGRAAGPGGGKEFAGAFRQGRDGGAAVGRTTT